MAPRSRTRPRRRRRILLSILGATVAAAAVVLGGAAALTGLEIHRSGSAAGDAPAWTAACYEHEPRRDRALLERCVRATGVVAHVREQRDGELYEVHFALLGSFGAMIVKLEEPSIDEVPAHGARVTVVGPLVRARNGMREVQTWSVGS